MKPFASRLRVLVQIIVLDLAEIPVIGVNQRFKSACIPVKRETDVADGAGFLFFGNPLLYADALQTRPYFRIEKHMHQVKVNVIRLQASELLLKKIFHGVRIL